jgi:flagellar biogenesis protein FliO
MTTNSAAHSSRLISVILLIGAALWSVMRLSSWVISLSVGYLLAIFEACQAIALKQDTQNEVTYNLMNYPDEVSANF